MRIYIRKLKQCYKIVLYAIAFTFSVCNMYYTRPVVGKRSDAHGLQPCASKRSPTTDLQYVLQIYICVNNKYVMSIICIPIYKKTGQTALCVQYPQPKYAY